MRKKQSKKQDEGASPTISAIFTEPPYAECNSGIANAYRSCTARGQAVEKAIERGGTNLQIAYSRYFGETLGTKGTHEE